MINKPYLVRVSENLIVNLQNVNTIEYRENKLFISQIGDAPDEALILSGDNAQATWIYFSSQMMSFRPLQITNPGQSTLDKFPNSTGE